MYKMWTMSKLKIVVFIFLTSMLFIIMVGWVPLVWELGLNQGKWRIWKRAFKQKATIQSWSRVEGEKHSGAWKVGEPDRLLNSLVSPEDEQKLPLLRVFGVIHTCQFPLGEQ